MTKAKCFFLAISITSILVSATANAQTKGLTDNEKRGFWPDPYLPGDGSNKIMVGGNKVSMIWSTRDGDTRPWLIQIDGIGDAKSRGWVPEEDVNAGAYLEAKGKFYKLYKGVLTPIAKEDLPKNRLNDVSGWHGGTWENPGYIPKGYPKAPPKVSPNNPTPTEPTLQNLASASEMEAGQATATQIGKSEFFKLVINGKEHKVLWGLRRNPSLAEVQKFNDAPQKYFLEQKNPGKDEITLFGLFEAMGMAQEIGVYSKASLSELKASMFPDLDLSQFTVK